MFVGDIRNKNVVVVITLVVVVGGVWNMNVVVVVMVFGDLWNKNVVVVVVVVVVCDVWNGDLWFVKYECCYCCCCELFFN